MLYAGCDLHKQTLSICVMNPARQIVKRTRLLCANEEAIRRFFEELGECEAVVEATAATSGLSGSLSLWPGASSWPIPRSFA